MTIPGDETPGAVDSGGVGGPGEEVAHSSGVRGPGEEVAHSGGAGGLGEEVATSKDDQEDVENEADEQYGVGIYLHLEEQ